jgi:hypothetical protein
MARPLTPYVRKQDTGNASALSVSLFLRRHAD